MGKLQMLKPRMASLNTSRAPILSANPDATPRMRGRALMERNEKWLRLHPLCTHCKEQDGIVSIGEQVDHIIPLWKGGPDIESNLQTLCTPHHKAKSAQEARERARGASLGEVRADSIPPPAPA